MSYERTKKWRQDYPEKARAQHLRIRQQRQTWLNSEKSFPCMDCKKVYPPYVMDFDHRKPEFKLGEMWACRSLTWLRLERQKCDLVCSNCHRERTFGQR